MRILALVAVVVAMLAPLAGAATAVAIDESTHEGKIVTLDDKGLELQSGEQKRVVPLSDLESLKLQDADDFMGRKDQTVLIAPDGTQLVLSGLQIDDSSLTLQSALLGERKLPMSAASMIYLAAKDKTARDIAEICQTMHMGQKAADSLVVQRKPGDYMTVDGVIKKLDDKTVLFGRPNDKDLPVPRETVLAIRLAAVSTRPAPAAGAVTTKDGSEVQVTSVTFKDGKWELQSPTLGKIDAPADNVAQVRLVSQRVVELSSLKPSQVKEYGFLDRVFKHRVNQSAIGGPIKLKGQAYPSGLGLHSFCELTYDLGGGYTSFVALAGIDDAVRPAGNARLTILGDGKELFKPAAVGGLADPLPIRLDLRGVKQLVIRVDFGADKVDAGDDVDLAKAKLIK